MDSRTDAGPTMDDVVNDGGAVLAALSMGTMVLFPLALPGIILVGVAVVPLVALGVVVAVVAAVVAAPVLAVRGLRRRSRSRREGVADRAARGTYCAPPPAGVARP